MRRHLEQCEYSIEWAFKKLFPAMFPLVKRFWNEFIK